MRRSKASGGVETIELDSWREFYDLIADDFANAPSYVFRGQANAAWKIESSLDRWERLHSKFADRPPVSRESEGRLHQRPHLVGEEPRLVIKPVQFLPVVLLQRRLVIPRTDLALPAVHKQPDDAIRLRRQMPGPSGHLRKRMSPGDGAKPWAGSSA